MSILFQVLALVSAVYVAKNLVTPGLKKLVHVDEQLPTFKALFGQNMGSFVQALVGFTEAFMPIFMIIGILFLDVSWTFFAASPILIVMFGAAVVHAFVWKNSPKNPILIFAGTLITLVFAGLM